jgi:hypothetical protein
VEPVAVGWTLNVVRVRLEPTTPDAVNYLSNGHGGVTVAYVGITKSAESNRYRGLTVQTLWGHESIKRLMQPMLQYCSVASVTVQTKHFGEDSRAFRGAVEHHETRYVAGELNDGWPNSRYVRGSCYAKQPFGEVYGAIGAVTVGRAMRDQDYKNGDVFG